MLSDFQLNVDKNDRTDSFLTENSRAQLTRVNENSKRKKKQNKTRIGDYCSCRYFFQFFIFLHFFRGVEWPCIKHVRFNNDPLLHDWLM